MANELARKPFLVVVDECHKIGAPGFNDLCEIKPEFRLGLSATPERYDPKETARVKYLCGKIVHRYGLKKAIKDGHLSKYHYNVSTAYLENDEQQKRRAQKEDR